MEAASFDGLDSRGRRCLHPDVSGCLDEDALAVVHVAAGQGLGASLPAAGLLASLAVAYSLCNGKKLRAMFWQDSATEGSASPSRGEQ